MGDTIRVLLIEDREDDALLIERELTQGGYTPSCLRVDSLEAVDRVLRQETFDVIISDYSLPHFNGLDVLHSYQATGHDIPFIIVSGTIGEIVAVETMKAGAQDYIMKGNLNRLVPAIRREIRDAAHRATCRRAEEQLRQTEKLRTVGELTAALIHDIKNPLQTILSASEMLGNHDLGPEQRTKFSTMIERQVARIIRMSQDIIDYVKSDITIERAPLDLASLVNELIDTYGKSFADAGVSLSCHIPEGTGAKPVVDGNEEKLWRALQNLIINAKDALPGGGEVRIQLSASDTDAVIEVVDTGIGVPEEIRNTLFKPFVSSGKNQGTGLGLAIVKQIVDTHGGRITCVTNNGKGTSFRIVLPRTVRKETTSPREMVIA